MLLPLLQNNLLSGGGGSSNTYTPGTGHLVLTGYQPSVVQTVSNIYTPGVGHLVLTGYQPTVIQSKVYTPATGHLVLTGYQPTVVKSALYTPISGHLVLTGYQPTVVQTSGTAPFVGGAGVPVRPTYTVKVRGRLRKGTADQLDDWLKETTEKAREALQTTPIVVITPDRVQYDSAEQVNKAVEDLAALRQTLEAQNLRVKIRNAEHSIKSHVEAQKILALANEQEALRVYNESMAAILAYHYMYND